MTNPKKDGESLARVTAANAGRRMSDGRTRNEGRGADRIGLAALRRWWAVAAWMGVLFVLSSQPELPRPPGLGPDLTAIAGHFIAYAVLAATLWWALSGFARSPWLRLVVAFLGALAYGASDEWHQSFVPDRHPALLDLAVDAAGAAGMLLVIALGRFSGRAPRTVRR